MKRRPTHPGVVLLEDVIKPLNLTITDAAKMLGVSRKALSEFVNEKAMLSPRWQFASQQQRIHLQKAG
ncbi:MAG: HigA family addiction module antitoxin [Lachnospiraceae bacterium]